MLNTSGSKLALVRDIAIIAACGFVLAGSWRTVRDKVQTWRTAGQQASAARAHWKDMTSIGEVVSPVLADSGDTSPVAATLVEFGDYECPFCRAAYPKLERLEASVPGLRLVYVQLPLAQIHPHAEAAAKAAICAGRQGRFAQLHHHLFTSTDWLDGVSWDSVARSVGIGDGAGFVACIHGSWASGVLGRHLRLARELHIAATPTFVQHGVVYGPQIPARSAILAHH